MAYALPLLACACGAPSVSPEQAEQQCRREAPLADGVRGNVGVGVGTGGAKAKGSITVTNRVLNPQTEEDFVRDCVDRRVSGKPAPVTVGVTLGGRT